MTSELQSIVLGALQGLTEFLPVSSSAHLVIAPWLFGWRDPGLAFDVALHLGTLCALVIYYRREWFGMASSLLTHRHPASRRLMMLLVAATIPGAAVGLALEKQAATIFRSPILIACTLAGFGLVLWIADRRAPRLRSIHEITLAQAILIGFAQAIAIVPGVSRSGATITVARMVGIEREDAANFSFLMAAPIIAGAGLFEVTRLINVGMTAALAEGFLSATVFGFAAIAGLVYFVRARTYAPFAWYRLALAALMIAVAVSRS